jgi:hypothetical protein
LIALSWVLLRRGSVGAARSLLALLGTLLPRLLHAGSSTNTGAAISSNSNRLAEDGNRRIHASVY